MTRRPLSRRTLLKGLGASLALPPLEMMQARDVSTAPQRLCCIFQPNGVYPKAWDVAGVGKDFQLSPILSPLQDLMGEFSVVSGLDNLGKGHVQLTGSFLTGKQITHQRNGVSLDQQVAAKVGHATPLSSVILGTEPPRQGIASGEPIAYANTVSWSSETTRVSPEINPQVAFDRLFRDRTGPEARKEALRRRSVLDLVLDDAKSLRRKAGSVDQAKLDEYLESVREVEVRLEKTMNPPEPEWTPTEKPEMMDRPGPGLPRDKQTHLRLMMDLMLLAFWTDTTRVGTLMTAHGFSRQNFSFLDGVTSDHHGMSHHKEKDDLVAEYTRVSQWYVENVAYLLGRMKAVKEGDGTLLSNSVVLYGSGMKDGNGHIKNNLPLLVAGQAGGKIRTGEHVRCDKGTPHSNLLHTLGLALGLENETFNGVSTGVVDQLVV
ncbi:MAG: DUF1552 domain-containing protein [Verrucomicrobiales bacterium]|nr:DUF1552 domain-containing protein [Verrucomicrobiales bacterium]